MRAYRLEFGICLFLVAATALVYLQLLGHDFISFDDGVYVTQNPYVQTGLTGETITWALTTTHGNFWHPLTWLSHMLDCELFGLNPGIHHLINLLFHMGNSILLFVVLRRMTGAIWRSAIVAALFALHPLHVESVAWVAERKDVLSTFFWMLTMWAYVRYTERPGVGRYVLVLILFVLGLISKPMVVTLPFVLLLMDYWPLGRIRLGLPLQPDSIKPQKRTIFELVWEKCPLFALAAFGSAVAYFAQMTAMVSLGIYPVKVRIANAVVSYVTYMEKMFWPQSLSVFYPYPEYLPLWQTVAAGLFLLIFSAVIFKAGARFLYLPVGWLWYVGTLLPVIGLVQVAGHAMADRYTYIPLIGLFILIAWAVPDLLEKWRYRCVVLRVFSGGLFSVLMILTWVQVRYWEDSMALFNHAINATNNNYLAHNSLGAALLGEGRLAEAIKHFREALRIRPDYAEANNNLGNAFADQGDIETAIRHYSEALRVKPNAAEIHVNLGSVLLRKGRLNEAARHYSEALRIKPDFAGAHNNLGIILAYQGDLARAISHFREALRLDPGDASARRNLERALIQEKKSGTPKGLGR